MTERPAYPDWESYIHRFYDGPIVSTFERIAGGDDRYQAWWSYVVFPPPAALEAALRHSDSE